MKNYYTSATQLARRMDPHSSIPVALKGYREKITYLTYEVKDLRAKLRTIRKILNGR